MKRTETREMQILRSARKKLGISQFKLALELDIQPRQYQRLECGEQPFSSVNIRLGLKICRFLQIDPFDLVLGERCSINQSTQLQSRPPGKKKRNYDSSWNGHRTYPDPTANQAIYNVSVEWERKRKLAIRLRLNGEEPDPLQFTGIFRRLITDPLEELMKIQNDENNSPPPMQNRRTH